MAVTKFSDIKYMNCESWFSLWYADKKAMLNIMYSNLNADLNAGYNPLGNCIQNQHKAIETYQNEVNKALDMFTEFDSDSKIERYCYYDLLKRGVIE